MSMLEAAIEYAEAGYSVFPLWGVFPNSMCRCGDVSCNNIGKHPVGWLVPTGLKEATDNVEMVKAWWRQEPSSGIGLRTGEEFFVLDFDSKAGVSAHDRREEFMGEFGALPDTAQAATGGGGIHDLFAMPEGIRIRNQQDLLAGGVRIQGIDVRGNDGYIVAPPSLHASGATYAWTRNPFEHTKAAPPWLLELVAGEVVESGPPPATPGAVPQPPVSGFSTTNEAPQPGTPADIEQIKAALAYIPPNTDRQTWLERVAMPLHDMFHGSDEGFEIFHAWCETATGERSKTPNGNQAYIDRNDCWKVWRSLHARHRNPKGKATFFETAMLYGYKEEVSGSSTLPASGNGTGGAAAEFEWPKNPQFLWSQSKEPDLDLQAAFPTELWWLRDLIGNIAKLQQVPVGFPALISLGMASGAVSKTFDIKLGGTGWVEPLSLWVMCAMSSGTGKSPVFKPLSMPFREFEKDQVREYERAMAKWVAIKKRLMAVAVKAERAAGQNASSPGMLESLIGAEGALSGHELDRPQSNGLLASSFTTPALVEFLMSHNERCLIIDPEGGVFEQVFNGRGDTDLDPWLKAFSCETIKQNRVGGRQGAIERHVHSPALSMAIATQTDAMDVFQDNYAASKGFLARFITAVFDHRLPTIGIIEGEIPAELTARWREVVYGLLELEIPSEPRHLILSGEAREVFVQWDQDRLSEAQRDPFADQESATGWATASGAKLRSQALRLVGLLHVLTDPDRAHDAPVSAALMRCVCEVWMPYVIANVKRTTIAVQDDPDLRIAERILMYLVRRDPGLGSKFSRSMVRDNLRGRNAGVAQVRTVNDLNMALSYLSDAGFIRPEEKLTMRGMGMIPAASRYIAHPDLVALLG